MSAIAAMDEHDARADGDRTAARGLVAPGPLRRPLLMATAAVASLGLAAELAEYQLEAPASIVEFFSLSYEGNLPTWYASVLLFACSALLAIIARAEYGVQRRRWWVLAGIFAYMSLDEAVELHEYLGWLIRGDGLLYYSWVLPAGAITLTIGLAYLPFLRALSSLTRWRFVLAGALYVGGALGMELPLGLWVATHGDDNLGYGLIDFVEESMELAGASVFLLALDDERRRSA